MTVVAMGTGDETKLAELLLYVAHEVQDDPTAGATKINKILFFSEFAHYRQHLVPITGVSYQKLPNGPAPRRLIPIRDRLVADGAAEIVHTDYLGYRMDRLRPLRAARVDLFSEDELRGVKEVVRWLWGKTAREVSSLSHDEMGWKMVDEGDDIPYSAALLATSAPATESVRAHARLLAERRKPA